MPTTLEETVFDAIQRYIRKHYASGAHPQQSAWILETFIRGVLDEYRRREQERAEQE